MRRNHLSSILIYLYSTGFEVVEKSVDREDAQDLGLLDDDDVSGPTAGTTLSGECMAFT
jgi:hypothetical protein